MGRPIPLCPDYDAPALRALARRSKDAAQSRRLLALAVIYDGGTRSEAARLGNVTLQIVRLGRSASKGCCGSTPRGRGG